MPHAWLDTLDVAAIGKLHRDLARLGISVANINANAASGYWNDAPPEPVFEPSLVSRNRSLREWRIAYTRKALRLGKELGAECVSITSGRALNGVPPESAMKLLLEGLKRLLEYAEKLGQRLALACAPTLLSESADVLAEVVAREAQEQTLRRAAGRGRAGRQSQSDTAKIKGTGLRGPSGGRPRRQSLRIGCPATAT